MDLKKSCNYNLKKQELVLMSKLKRPTIADGILYYNSKVELTNFTKSSIAANTTEKSNTPFAIVTPNSNYLLAGNAYGASYSQLINEQYDTAIIISPIHKMSFYAIGLSSSDYFESPLGDVEVDKEANDILRSYSPDFFVNGEKYHMAEHSIEVQLPYLITTLGNKTKILPIIMGEPNTKFSILMSKGLKYLFEKSNKRYIIIVVTNLSNGLNNDKAVAMDTNFIEIFKENDPDHLAEQLALNQIKADGGGGLVSLLRLNNLLDTQKEINILKYFTSGDVTEDRTKVEGYLSAVL